MSMAQNLLYSGVQAAHNFGAVAAVGGSLAGWVLKTPTLRDHMAKVTAAGWLTQALSGACFGAVSYYYYHRLPDLGEISIGALLVKMACVATALALFAFYFLRGRRGAGRAGFVWPASLALAATALTAAAVLRWFS